MGRLRDYLRSFLGVPQDNLKPHELPRNIYEDFHQEFGHNFEHNQPYYPIIDQPGEHHIYHDESDSHDDMVTLQGGDLFKEIEDLFENFFNGSPFSFYSSPDALHESIPEDFESSPDHQNSQTPDQHGSLRDKMLKNPDSDNYEGFGNHHGNQTPFPGLGPHSLFEGLWKSPFDHSMTPDDQIDKDLDNDIESGKQSLDEILSKRDKYSPGPVMPMNPRSSLSLYSSVTTIDSSGCTESRTTRHDSSGREEVTITRKIGDQEHTVKQRRGEDGSQVSEESTANIDKDELTDFDEKWNQNKQGSPSIIQDNDASPFSSIYDSILEQLFPKRR